MLLIHVELALFVSTDVTAIYRYQYYISTLSSDYKPLQDSWLNEQQHLFLLHFCIGLLIQLNIIETTSSLCYTSLPTIQQG